MRQEPAFQTCSGIFMILMPLGAILPFIITFAICDFIGVYTAYPVILKYMVSEEDKKAVINRISRAIGHLEKVKNMVETDVDCSEVLIQLAAVKSAINNTGKVILKNHIDHCIVEALEHNDLDAVKDLNEAIDKFIK